MSAQRKKCAPSNACATLRVPEIKSRWISPPALLWPNTHLGCDVFRIEGLISLFQSTESASARRPPAAKLLAAAPAQRRVPSCRGSRGRGSPNWPVRTARGSWQVSGSSLGQYRVWVQYKKASSHHSPTRRRIHCRRTTTSRDRRSHTRRSSLRLEQSTRCI